MTEAPPIVYVVDDDASMREALAGLVRSLGIEPAVFASADEFLAQELDDRPSCLVLDVMLPGLSGLDLQRALVEAGDAPPIIFITGHGDIPMSVRAMKAGAVEFLPKPFAAADLAAAIDEALRRDREARARSALGADVRARYAQLSAREREVVSRVVRGLLNKQIAAELGIAEITVKAHRRHIMRKLQLKSLPDLVRVVESLGPGNA